MIQVERRTIASPLDWSGLGLHSGEPVRVTLHPGADGIAFRSAGVRVPARPENVTETSRCTRLGEISTIEHLMSALAACEITDAEIEVVGGELPGLDGSAAPYVQAITDAGVESLGSAEIPDLFTRVFLQEDHGLKLAIGKGTGQWRYVYDLGPRWPHCQSFEVRDVIAEYRAKIGPARTLVLREEIEMAQRMGLGRGLDEHSVVILDDADYRYPPRFPDEPARHKLLDVIGDLYLAGIPIRWMNVVAEKSGHRTNVEAAALLARR